MMYLNVPVRRFKFSLPDDSCGESDTFPSVLLALVSPNDKELNSYTYAAGKHQVVYVRSIFYTYTDKIGDWVHSGQMQWCTTQRVHRRTGWWSRPSDWRISICSEEDFLPEGASANSISYAQPVQWHNIIVLHVHVHTWLFMCTFPFKRSGYCITHYMMMYMLGCV